MTMYLDRVGAESERVRFTWQPRDCSLYALAVGAGIEDTDYTTEDICGAEQLVYPTFAFAVTTAVAATWPDPTFATGDFEPEHVVLGEQTLQLLRPLQASGDVVVSARVAGIYDKGSGALLSIEYLVLDNATGDSVFTGSVRMFIIGEGGFGGIKEPSRVRVEIPAREPDERMSVATLPIQTLLYRHGGNDANPLHVNPAFARQAGFRSPLITGQNLLGYAARALIARVIGDPRRVTSLQARFSKPAYNGDTLTTEFWSSDTPVDSTCDRRLIFRVTNQDEDVVVDAGMATYS